jgi:hypothetical protein
MLVTRKADNDKYLPDCLFIPNMKAHKVSSDLAWAIVRMSALLSIQDIEAYTAISEQQIRRILACWRKIGDVRAPRQHPSGQHQQLTAEDLAVGHFFFL